ncbi:protein Tube isoform X2 [Drosophila ficusphila]|uniref:protein Tube isoform X2 n=1 Tax=Drosophila ficusphila TaxID=30025 RepID=UPI0007E6B6F3|nr:protein Tube isoform X2 [Drosophila ficusphila]
MAKANGWNGVQVNGSCAPICSSKYSRSTELRRVEDNDIYRLAKILDENACWRKLMSIIPKGMDVQACSAAGGLNFPVAMRNGFKYTSQDVFQIDEAANRLSPDQSKSQMMIDEWKTSGKLNERPTVGVLLQLLVQAELFSAADFVALNFLNESTPDRPAEGPAAPISLDEDMDVDNEGLSPSFQPTTATLGTPQGSVGLNLDTFEKHMVARDKSVPQPSREASPVFPLGPTTSSSAASTAGNERLQPRPQNIPNLSILHGDSTTTASTSLANSSSRATSAEAPNIPRITLLIDNSVEKDPHSIQALEKAAKATTPTVNTNNLPMISALNINNDNGETSHPDSNSTTSSLSNDEDDNDDDDDEEGEGEYADASLPNTSNSEQQNSNNDSSLTTVTGTSGDNSFEMTNDSSSTSNDDYACNIPNLSELQQ